MQPRMIEMGCLQVRLRRALQSDMTIPQKRNVLMHIEKKARLVCYCSFRRSFIQSSYGTLDPCRWDLLEKKT